MHTVGDCIDSLNREKCYEKEIKNYGLYGYLLKTKSLLNSKNKFCSKLINCLLSITAIIKYEKLFYLKHSSYTKNTSNLVFPELKKIINPVQLKTHDCETIDIWDINPYKSRKYIIFCAGISSEKTCINLQLSYLKLIQSGWGIIAFDYRGRGKSSGEFSQKGAFIDMCTIYNYLNKKNIESKDIGIIGHSMGTGVAADFSSGSGLDLAFTVLINPFYSACDMSKNIAAGLQMPSIIKKTIKRLPDFCIPLQNKFDNKTALKRIKSPVLLIHCTNDETIPASQARKLYSKTNNENVKYIELKSSDHEMNDEKTDICLHFIEEL